MFTTPADDSIIITWRSTTIRRFPASPWWCYLLHFEHKYFHAGHYIGMTGCLEARLKLHRAGGGARLMEVVVHDNHIGFEVARLWPCESYEEARALERKLKRTHGHGPALCPICSGRPVDVYTALRQGKWPLRIHAHIGRRRSMGERSYQL